MAGSTTADDGGCDLPDLLRLTDGFLLCLGFARLPCLEVALEGRAVFERLPLLRAEDLVFLDKDFALFLGLPLRDGFLLTGHPPLQREQAAATKFSRHVF